MKLLEQLHQEIIESDWAKYFEVVKEVNKWERRIEELQNELLESDEWVKVNWRDLPESVQMLIVRGQARTGEKIEKFKELAAKQILGVGIST